MVTVGASPLTPSTLAGQLDDPAASLGAAGTLQAGPANWPGLSRPQAPYRSGCLYFECRKSGLGDIDTPIIDAGALGHCTAA